MPANNEEVISRALEIMKQNVDYVPQSADWEKTLRPRVINYWKQLHHHDRVEDFCKRNQGKRVLLLTPDPKSDFGEAYSQALEEMQAQHRIVFTNGQWAGGTRTV